MVTRITNADAQYLADELERIASGGRSKEYIKRAERLAQVFRNADLIEIGE